MRLQDYINEHGLTHSSFADTIGVKKESVRRYAKGERIPRREIAEKIHAATNGEVTPNDFYQAPT
jgi:transcriptional regulator with XRE-family HTH domain